jgi:hypothetical protein
LECLENAHERFAGPLGVFARLAALLDQALPQALDAVLETGQISLLAHGRELTDEVGRVFVGQRYRLVTLDSLGFVAHHVLSVNEPAVLDIEVLDVLFGQILRSYDLGVLRGQELMLFL